MSVHIKPISEVSNRARNILVQELGIIDTMRFLNQFGTGSGDYTAQREQLFKGESVKSVLADIKAKRSKEI